MILTSKVEIKISVSNMKYWRNLGYNFKNPSPKYGIIPILLVNVEHLQPKSNVDVECLCDSCNRIYVQRFSRNTDVCYDCRKSEQMKGNTFGSVNKGKQLYKMCGENHPRWSKNKNEYNLYRSKVYSITRQQDLSLLEDHEKPRGRCGVDGAYQLDHIISIKHGFENNIEPEIIGNIDNLRFISWEENRSKWFWVI